MLSVWDLPFFFVSSPLLASSSSLVLFSFLSPFHTIFLFLFTHLSSFFLSLSFLSHLSSFTFFSFPLLSFTFSFCLSTLPSLFLLSFLSFYLSLFSPFFSTILKNIIETVLLVGHNHKMWKSVTQFRPLILYLRKPRVIEMGYHLWKGLIQNPMFCPENI